MRGLRTITAGGIAVVLGAGLAVSGVTSASAATAGHWGVFTVAGSARAYSGAVALPGFPETTFTSTSRQTQVVSGASTWQGPSTPPGAVYGSSRGNSYINQRPDTDNATSPAVTTYTFAGGTPGAGGWSFVLGDIDADQATITATLADGTPASVAQLGFAGAYNSCSVVSPGGWSCDADSDGTTGRDVPTWNATTGVLVGNPTASDTAGATAWFTPTASLGTLTITYQQRSGFPVYQTWFANRTSSLSGVATLDGAALPGTLVTATAPNGTEYTTTTDADGAYSFDALTQADGYRVSIATPDNAAVDRAPAALSLRSDVTGADFAFSTPPGTVEVDGTVVDEDGLPVADATVTVTDPATGHPRRGRHRRRRPVERLRPARGDGDQRHHRRCDAGDRDHGRGRRSVGDRAPDRRPGTAGDGERSRDARRRGTDLARDHRTRAGRPGRRDGRDRGGRLVRPPPASGELHRPHRRSGDGGHGTDRGRRHGPGRRHGDGGLPLRLTGPADRVAGGDGDVHRRHAGRRDDRHRPPGRRGCRADVQGSTGADGSFDLVGLTPATPYVLTVDGADPRTVTSAGSGAAPTPVAFVLPLPTVEQPGTVTDADGAAVRGAEVVATPVDPADGSPVEATTDADGAFDLTGLRPSTAYSVVATVEDLASEPVAVTTAAVGATPTPLAIALPAVAVPPTTQPTPAPTAPVGPGTGPTTVPVGSAGGTVTGGALAFTGAELTPGLIAAGAFVLLGGGLLTFRAVRNRRRTSTCRTDPATRTGRVGALPARPVRVVAAPASPRRAPPDPDRTPPDPNRTPSGRAEPPGPCRDQAGRTAGAAPSLPAGVTGPQGRHAQPAARRTCLSAGDACAPTPWTRRPTRSASGSPG